MVPPGQQTALANGGREARFPTHPLQGRRRGMKMSFAASAIALVGLGVAGLAACSPSAPPADGATPAAPESAAAAAPAAAPPSQGEGPAAGKWKLTTTAMGQAMPPSEVC